LVDLTEAGRQMRNMPWSRINERKHAKQRVETR
jgi:hypothetical protein